MEIFEAILEWGASYAPRSVRIGCWVLLAVIALALLTLALWVPR